MQIQTGHRMFCMLDNYGDSRTYLEYEIHIVLPLQQWLRERNAQLRYTYSASYVPCYVRLLCTSTVCSVYRVPSVIMCSSTLILPSFAVTAVRFEMRYHFSTRVQRAQYQYTCTTRYSKHVHVGNCSGEMKIILPKIWNYTQNDGSTAYKVTGSAGEIFKLVFDKLNLTAVFLATSLNIVIDSS